MEVPAPVGLPVGTKVALCNYTVPRWMDLNGHEGVVQGVVMEGGSVHRYLVKIRMKVSVNPMFGTKDTLLRVAPENLIKQ